MKKVRLLTCSCLITLAAITLAGCSGEKAAEIAKPTATQNSDPNANQVIKDSKASGAGADYIKTHAPASGPGR